uniref:Uncharacterized protein n=1 Tax=Pseudomonas fluorescens TaxID=294 RepID=A0A5E6W4R4_PSEFL|nr:hypothetical protein PS652_04455 [Pseudomonas fluorescens]
MVSAQQLMGGVVFHHGDFQAVQVLDSARLRAAFMGQDDNREIQVRAGKGQKTLAFGGRHDAGQQVEFVLARLLEYGGPADRFDRLELHTQAFLDKGNVVGGQSLVATVLVPVFKRWPGCIDAQAQLRMCAEPGLFFFSQGQGAGRCTPDEQESQQKGRHSGHNGLVTQVD